MQDNLQILGVSRHYDLRMLHTTSLLPLLEEMSEEG